MWFGPLNAIAVGYPYREFRNMITNDGPLVISCSFPSLTNKPQRIAGKIILATLSLEPEQMLILKEKERYEPRRDSLRSRHRLLGIPLMALCHPLHIILPPTSVCHNVAILFLPPFLLIWCPLCAFLLLHPVTSGPHKASLHSKSTY